MYSGAGELVRLASWWACELESL